MRADVKLYTTAGRKIMVMWPDPTCRLPSGRVKRRVKVVS